MAALLRIIVVSAVFYLARFAIADQHSTENRYSDSDSAYSQKEDSISDYKESNERILIESGVPLRGRTIHRTAWSEEDKISETSEESSQQAGEAIEEKELYDSWSLTKAINYILSFIYDTDGDGDSVLFNILPENSNEKLASPESEFDGAKTPQSDDKIIHSKEKSEKIPIHNNNEDIFSKTTPSYIIAYFENEDIDWFENEISSINNEEPCTNSHDEDSELAYEIEDSDEVALSYELEDDINNVYIINKATEGELPDINSKIDEEKNYTQKATMKKPLIKIREKEPEFDADRHDKSMESEQEEEGTLNLKQDDIPSSEEDKTVRQTFNKVYMTGNDRKTIESTTRPSIQQLKKLSNQEESTDTENYYSLDINSERTKEGEVPNTDSRTYKSNTNEDSIQPQTHINQVGPAPKKGVSEIKNKTEEKINRTPNAMKFTTKPSKGKPSFAKDKISNEIHSDDVNSDRYADDGGDGDAKTKMKPLEKRTIERTPSTLSYRNQEQSQYQEPSSESDPRSQNGKTKLHIAENKQGRGYANINQPATTMNPAESQRDKFLKTPNYNSKTTVKSINRKTSKKNHPSKNPANKNIKGVEKELVTSPQYKSLETHSNASRFPNAKSLTKTSKDQDLKHAKAKDKYLGDIHLDLEPDDIGSYNYILDSFEFIRINENNNKFKKKPDGSMYTIVNDKKQATEEKNIPFLSVTTTTFQPPIELERINESQETFDTILEYLYRTSNSSFLLSLQNQSNSSEN